MQESVMHCTALFQFFIRFFLSLLSFLFPLIKNVRPDKVAIPGINISEIFYLLSSNLKYFSMFVTVK